MEKLGVFSNNYTSKCLIEENTSLCKADFVLANLKMC